MIKFVYFDVGGVVIKDFSGTNKWNDLIQEIGVTSKDRAKFDEIWGCYADTVCTTFDVEQLIPILVKELHIHIHQDYSLLMGFVNRFEKNEDIWPVIAEISKQVPVGMLTNMYINMKEKIEAAGLFPDIDWKIIIDSSIEKLQKPDAAIYKLAEKKAGVSGGDILFVDNSQAHLDAAARNFGWQTFLFDPKRNSESSDELMKFFNSNK